MSNSYRVLAQRLRPKRFQDLVGQDIFVELIQKSFLKERLASGFLLTGIRGVGKTTIARLLAKTMNCSEPIKQEKSIEPCGRCISCEAFDAGHHTDILEMDAASHTGVDDIRRILDTCQYNPLQGAYKVFIIDEVHMLSKSAFNALLKTLETPPPHVKFIFATTEVEKIPLTVMSRCLRFDLRRIDSDVMHRYLANVCQEESFTCEEQALNLIVEAADGSLRDALSILEQGLLMVQQDDEGVSHLSIDMMSQLLGIQSAHAIKKALVGVLSKDAQGAIQASREAYDGGGDPVMFLDQMASFVYQISCVKMESKDASLSRFFHDQDFLKEMATKYALSILGRMWQMLLKGRQELLNAPFPQRNFEMLLIRLAYASQLPTPEKLFSMTKQKETALSSEVSSSEKMAHQMGEGNQNICFDETVKSDSTPSVHTHVKTAEDILNLLSQHREGLLHAHFLKSVQVVDLQDPHLTIAVDHLSETFPQTLQKFLSSKTGRLWQVKAVKMQGELETLDRKKEEQKKAYYEAAEEISLVKKAREIFGEHMSLSLKESEQT